MKIQSEKYMPMPKMQTTDVVMGNGQNGTAFSLLQMLYKQDGEEVKIDIEQTA
jgi:hypothetical protein